MLKLSSINHAINFTYSNKSIYPHPLITPSNLCSQYQHQYLVNWTHACKAKTINNFCKKANQLQYTKKYFFHKNISLKHSGVRSYFSSQKKKKKDLVLNACAYIIPPFYFSARPPSHACSMRHWGKLAVKFFSIKKRRPYQWFIIQMAVN